MYIPVADETCGGMPKLSNNGLKILPPPCPREPDIIPPVNEKNNSLNNGQPDIGISDSVIPFPYLILSCYYALYFMIEYEVNIKENTTKTNMPAQSRAEQDVTPNILGFLAEPL